MQPQVNIVIPTLGKNRMVISLLDYIEEEDEDILRTIFVLDNGMPEGTAKDCARFPHVKVIDCKGMKIYRMWNKGVQYSIRTKPTDYIAIFNDDIITNTGNFLTNLVEPLDCHEDIWAACGNYDQRDCDDYYQEVTGTFKDGGFAGFCFAVKGEAYLNGLPLFEERYNWWYGDDDFLHNIHKLGKRAVMSRGAYMFHIGNGSNTIEQYTDEFNEMVAKDREIYMRKWHR